MRKFYWVIVHNIKVPVVVNLVGEQVPGWDTKFMHPKELVDSKLPIGCNVLSLVHSYCERYL
jgi:hypothetical protein